MREEKIHLRVLTRGEMLYEGDVTSFTSVNELGKFDVLIEHANFISMVKDYLIIRERVGRELKIKIAQGIYRAMPRIFDNISQKLLDALRSTRHHRCAASLQKY